MSQSRGMTYQTVKSLNYLYKVCSGTNGSRNHCSVSSLKALSFVNKFSTLNSAAADESFDFQNPNVVPANVKNSSGYGNYNYRSIRVSNSEFDQNPDGVYRENSMGVQKNPSGAFGQSYNCNRNYQNKILEHSSNTLYEEGRNVQSSYNALSNQQSNVAIYETPNGSYNGMVNSQGGDYFQLNEKSYNAVEEGLFHGTIEELDAFCKDGKLKEAVEVLEILEKNKVPVDIPRYLFLMNACGESQALKEAKHVHNHLTRSLPHFDVYICNKILEMYSKCGSMEDAYKVFDKMPQRNLTSWDTMITWLAKNGHGEDAIAMFTEFKRVGLKPDHQMFLGVFTACSVLGDMREGLLHFESMTKTYNLIPSMDHYVKAVDMLGSSGYLNEALEFIKKMPIEPSVEIWETLMNLSRVHGDLELGNRCAEIVHLLDPSRLDEQSKEGFIPLKPSDIAKEKEKEKEKKKSSFNNLLEPKTKVREYRAGDTSHPEHEKLYDQLRCLKQHMKEAGYVPEYRFVLHDVDLESKEDALLSHSERLALSQALLTSPARAQIRIIKNLRVCGDCHNALKIISKLVGRLIIARDAKRFHHFENGQCSCGDYW
ncbi:hypothetical protein L2E82_23237 [Cichorium intybus]|uniref:Uncharacterized protein n=1 Tax=Cichorium intybus TaxID=13427 RepID=A0ACB9DZT6_CICIN|nr:hypothetical protein L2E82_23237 [Cichorium intybus]